MCCSVYTGMQINLIGRVKQNSVGANVFHDCSTIANENGGICDLIKLLTKNFFPSRNLLSAYSFM